MRHDVTPVAGGIADGEEYRLFLSFGPLECFRAPRIPVHRIIGMLQQIRTFLLGEPVLTVAESFSHTISLSQTGLLCTSLSWRVTSFCRGLTPLQPLAGGG